MKLKSICAWFGLLAAAGCCSTAFGSVLYNNTTTDLGTRFDAGSNEVGDEIILKGGNQFQLNELKFEYWGIGFSGNNNETMRIRLYLNDGADVNGSASPGSLIYDSSAFSIAATTRSVVTIGAQDLASLPTVSSHITFSVLFGGIEAGESAGLDLFNPPAIGNSYDDYWQKNGANWELRTSAGTPINFAAQVSGVAVPEPSTMALFSTALACAAAVVVRKKRTVRV